MDRSPILDHPLLCERYFFPRADLPPAVTRVAVDGVELACAAHCPHADAPLIVHFHGNGETVADYFPLFAGALADAGLNAFFVEYRGYGGSSGRPALVRMLADVGPVLASLGAPPERTFVYGRSLGSIYAIEAVHRCPALAGLILESGIADPLERVLLRVTPEELGATLEALTLEVAAHLDHQRKLEAYPGRVLVLHASGDRTVDPSHAERNAGWARRARVVMFPRGDHNTILAENLRAIVRAVRQFVRES